MKSEIEVKAVKAGDGTHYPVHGQTVRIHYVGRLPDGTRFDSSRDRHRSYEFKLGAGQVIPGLEMALPQMSRGQVSKVTIPPELAYGIHGYPPIIPRNAVLVYEVELLSFI